MRQAGVLAAAALVGLADVEEVLLRDHRNARRFAQGARTSCPLPHFLLLPEECLGGPLQQDPNPQQGHILLILEHEG